MTGQQSKPTMPSYSVGDRVAVRRARYHQDARVVIDEAEVVSVGRKWLGLQRYSWKVTKFDKVTGAGQGIHYVEQIVWPELLEWEGRLKAAHDILRSQRVYDLPNDLSLDQLERIVAILEEARP